MRVDYFFVYGKIQGLISAGFFRAFGVDVYNARNIRKFDVRAYGLHRYNVQSRCAYRRTYALRLGRLRHYPVAFLGNQLGNYFDYLFFRNSCVQQNAKELFGYGLNYGR